MRIALLTETYLPEINGVARTLARLVRELKVRGHSIHIIRPQQKSDKQHSIGTGSDENDLDITTLVNGIKIPGYSSLQFGLPAYRKLKSLWGRQQPDVIYVATEGPLGWSAVRAANKLNIPVVSGFHTNFDAYSKHYRLGFLENIIFAYLKRLHNKTKCTLAPSTQMVEKLRSKGIKETHLFSRGVDTGLFSPVHRDDNLRGNWVKNNDDTVCLYVGRVAAEKNISTVVSAFDAMKQVNEQVQLVVVGDGPLLKSLMRQREDIIFAGEKIANELSRYYASADIFLFASETETFGNVVVEAMSSGLCVVSNDYAAGKMHIKHKQNGITVEFANKQAFLESCRELIADKELIKRTRQAARETAEQIDWKQVIDSFEGRLESYVKKLPGQKNTNEQQALSADGST